MTIKLLHFKWTVSRGRNTYGYNICTLLVDGEKVGRCNGGGYDMQGTAFGEWLTIAFQSKLTNLFKDEIAALPIKSANSSKFYGAHIYKDGTVNLDGGCGFDSMKRIADAIGIKIKRNKESDKYKNHSFYTAIIN